MNFLEELLSFHQKLYDLDLEAFPAKRPEVPLSTQTSIHYFRKNNASFCLPPKSGSTNWLLALEPLADEYRNDPFSRADFGPESNIYRRLPSLTNDELTKNFRGVRKSRKVMTTRNPISRLFSAWKDKFRFQQERLINFRPMFDRFLVGLGSTDSFDQLVLIWSEGSI